MSARPFRRLCPDVDARDAMTDAEFWAHVLGADAADYEPEIDPQMDLGPCPVCGSSGACSYDADGLPLIHASEES